jgi:hypothetical protein
MPKKLKNSICEDLIETSVNTIVREIREGKITLEKAREILNAYKFAVNASSQQHKYNKDMYKGDISVSLFDKGEK